MEFLIPKFQERFSSYNDNIDNLSEKASDNSLSEGQRGNILVTIKNFQDLDVKLRLAFGIQEILLNPQFVSEKQGDLKDCHLMYYKLADLWFAYEAFFKFDKSLLGSQKNKILWLGTAAHTDYSNNCFINSAFELCALELRGSFDSVILKSQLIDYLKHCTQAANGGQLKRLEGIILRMEVGDFDFDFTKDDILTLTYAVRNNFVHNGESTIAPDDFGFVNKKLLLTALYRNLAILTIESTNITCSKFLVA